jgi:hypothetical protein
VPAAAANSAELPRLLLLLTVQSCRAWLTLLGSDSGLMTVQAWAE